jgi:hypothetical protein
MTMSFRLVAKSGYVCNDVVGDSQTGKVSLFNLWDAVRIPSGMGFSYYLAKLCVFAWWRDGLGKVRTRIDLLQASTQILIRRTSDCTIDFASRTTSVFARYRLENCVFPEAGVYYIELFCEDEFVDDQIIQVYPPAG